MNTQMHLEALRAPRPEPRYIEGWPPGRPQGPPGGRRLRRAAAERLVRLARRLDDRAARRVLTS